MNIDRRALILPALALGLLSVLPSGLVPAFAASPDEEAVAKNVEAFRKAQIAANAEILATLVAEGCDEMQGYLIGRPRPIEVYANLLGDADGQMRTAT